MFPSSSCSTLASPFAATLVDLLRMRAEQQPEQVAYVFLNDHGVESESLTYKALDQRARAIAAFLQSRNAAGSLILLLYPSCLEFVAAFFGCMYARALAVPVYPPRRNQLGARVDAIRVATRARLALTDASTQSSGRSVSSSTNGLGELEWLDTETIGEDYADAWREPQLSGNDLAFLQFTSGSVSAPKGVMLSHENILYNQRMIEGAFEHTESSRVLGWLPLYHDMGLIGNVLQPLYMGVPCFLMSPLAFLLRPYRWLQAISRFRITTSGAPDFAYDLCVRKVTPEQCANLDLSSWDLAFCGSERVRYETVQRFTEKFTPYGFRREAFYPCYGLAEATLLVSGGQKKDVPVVCEVPETMLSDDRDTKSANTSKLVSCGSARLSEKILIVDPETLIECPDGTLGEVWISGTNVAQGYWNNPDETEKVFKAYLQNGEGPFLRTGDLGFLLGGELFIQGRIKDVIVVRGCKFYAEDIEQSVECSNDILIARRGAALAVNSSSGEKLVIVHEVQRKYRSADQEQVTGDIREAVTEKFGIQVHAIALIKAGTIPLTSSGKIQRARCRELFLNKGLEVVGS